MGDYRTTTGEAPPLSPQQRRRRRRRWAIGLAAVGLAAALAGYGIRVERVVWASGYVLTEDYAEVRPLVQGLIAEIHAQSGDAVERGKRLARLEDAEQAAALQEARSRLRQLEADAGRREAEIAERRRRQEYEAEAAQLRLQSAESRLQRQRELQTRGLASAAAVEEAVLQRALAETELRMLRERDPTLFDREIEAIRHEVEAGREAVVRTEAQWRQRQIVAPISGTAVRSEFTVGELVRPDQVLYEIYGGEPCVLKGRVEERHATRVRPGQRYEARLTPYSGWGGSWFEGRVESLRDVIQTDGARTYRTLYGRLELGDVAVPPGTTAEIRIFTGKTRLWMWLIGAD